MNSKMIKYSVLVVVLAAIITLLNYRGGMSNAEIRKSWWKYGSGYHLGDALRFDENNLKGDTIYRLNQPVALISYCGKGLFRRSAILKIESIETWEQGVYHEK